MRSDSQAHEDRLRLRIAEAAVELEHLRRAVGRRSSAPRTETPVGHAIGGKPRDGRIDDLAHDALVQRGVTTGAGE